jgi:heme exporter protein A
VRKAVAGAVNDGILIDDVSKRYGTRWALARVTLQIARGECVMLAGHNGSGKTTLLRLIAGLLSATHGRVSVLGSTSKQAARERVALLSHQSGHYDDLSARENLELHAQLLGRGDIDGTLARVGLKERADTPVRQFSAGMKKRLSLARTMLKAPPVILLDEPFGELDPQGMDFVEQWIAQERKAGTTILLATHWLEQGARLSDRSIRLEGGRVQP